MDFNTFVGEAIEYANRHREQRFGQALVNALTYNRPNLVGVISEDLWETDDPQDPSVYKFFEELRQVW